MGMLYRLISRFCILLYYLGIMSNFAHTGHYLRVLQTTLLILPLKSYINETSAHMSTLRWCREAMTLASPWWVQLFSGRCCDVWEGTCCPLGVRESLVVRCCVFRAWRWKYWCMGMLKYLVAPVWCQQISWNAEMWEKKLFLSLVVWVSLSILLAS